MSEDEITKGSVMVQMKAAEKPFCCGTVYYTKYHIRWFGFWVWLCNLIQWHDHSNEISLFAILTCTKGKIIFFLFALIKKIYQNLGSFYCNFGVLRFETVNCTMITDLNINVAMATMISNSALQTQMHQSFKQEKSINGKQHHQGFPNESLLFWMISMAVNFSGIFMLVETKCLITKWFI